MKIFEMTKSLSNILETLKSNVIFRKPFLKHENKNGKIIYI